ncbi:MAG TPA: hypothetical protein VHM20_08585 [Gammaproteobacteria bacterium]|nr:hypothetical protein [Gammaproteobacteria bacterium]
MLRIENIDDFSDFLQKNPPLKENNCCPRKKDIRNSLAQIFCQLYDHLEKTPLVFEESPQKIAAIRLYYLKYLKAGEIFLEYLESDAFEGASVSMQKVLQRIIGLKYRIEKVYGGLDPLPDSDFQVFRDLLKKLEIFKRKQKLYDDTSLTEQDWAKLIEVSRYYSFAKTILVYPDLRDNFFKWTFRDNNVVNTFVEFPAIAERLKNAFLDKRIGYFHPEELQVFKENKQKIVTLRMYDGEKVQHINILDENQVVTLNHHRIMTVREIFKIFANKKITPGNLEYFGQNGIMNWSSYEMGAWNVQQQTYARISFINEKWWQALPYFEIISRKKLAKRYHLTLQKNDWVQTIKATREAKNFDLLKRHGYFEMAIPIENDCYALYPFGKYPAEFPTRTIDQLQILSGTVLAKMQYPDENEFYSQRQHASCSSIISEEVGLKKMAEIKNKIIASLENNVTFHFGGENCAYFADNIAGTSYFMMPFSQMSPANPFLEFVLKCPLMLQPYIASLMQWMAKKNGITVQENGKAVYKHTIFGTNFETTTLSQPARLFQQIEEKKLTGVIKFGNRN